jgi:predicted methyltransferase
MQEDLKVSTGPTRGCALAATAFAGTLLGAVFLLSSNTLAQDYAAIISAPDRSEEDRKTDERRNPGELLRFSGVRTGMRVLDLGAGGGYTTELLARVIGPAGHVYAQTPRQASERLAARLQRPFGQNITHLAQAFDAALPAQARNLDVVTFILNYHDTVHLGVDRRSMNNRAYEALKAGGVFIVVDHAAKTGAGLEVAGTLHRIEESAVRSEIEAAGFRFKEAGEFLRNPMDSREKTSERDPATDRFVLKFEKPR